MDERNFFRDDDDDDYDDDDDFINLPDLSNLKSTQQNRSGGFDPFVENPRMYTREQLEKGGARELIDNVRQRARKGVEPARKQNQPMPPQGNPKGKKGSQPTQAPSQAYNIPIPIQPSASGGPQTIVIGYDPVTGAIHQPTGNPTITQQASGTPQPIILAYPQETPASAYQIVTPGSCYPQACYPQACYPQACYPQAYVIPA